MFKVGDWVELINPAHHTQHLKGVPGQVTALVDNQFGQLRVFWIDHEWFSSVQELKLSEKGQNIEDIKKLLKVS